MITKVQEHLLSLKDEKYLAFHSKLCTTSNRPMIGIRVPLIRAYAKQLLKEGAVTFKNEYYEEVLLQGFYIARLDSPYEEKVLLVEEFLPLIDNWAICDSFVSSLKFIKSNRKVYYRQIKKYLGAENEYVKRFALVVLLNHYMVAEYIDDILEIIKNTQYCGYYSMMAGSWLLSYCFIFYFTKTLDYIKNNDLNMFIKKTGIRKALESRRISDSNKEALRRLY